MIDYKNMTYEKFMELNIFQKYLFKFYHKIKTYQLFRIIRKSIKNSKSQREVDIYSKYESILKRSCKKGITLEENEALADETRKITEELKQQQHEVLK